MTPKHSQRHSPSETKHSEPGPQAEAAAPAESPPSAETATPGAEAAAPEEDANAAAVAAAAAELQAEIGALQDRYLRLAAEFDNYRKRTERERLESGARAQARLVAGLLEPIDDLQRVVGLDPESTSVAAVLEGVRLVERKLLRALEQAGLEVIDAAGTPFDPNVHEALAATPTAEPAEDDTVAEVFQKGYRFKDTLLRPARVRVRKYEG
jgi:molecular chaperone GrpE